jgi:hypothetical protein
MVSSCEIQMLAAMLMRTKKRKIVSHLGLQTSAQVLWMCVLRLQIRLHTMWKTRTFVLIAKTVPTWNGMCIGVFRGRWKAVYGRGCSGGFMCTLETTLLLEVLMCTIAIRLQTADEHFM